MKILQVALNTIILFILIFFFRGEKNCFFFDFSLLKLLSNKFISIGWKIANKHF